MLRDPTIVVRALADTDMFGHHASSDATSESAPTTTLGVLQPPPMAALRAKCRAWALDVARRAFVERVDDLAAEAQAVRLAAALAATRHSAADRNLDAPSPKAL